MKINLFLIITTFLSFSLAKSQSTDTKSADKHFERYEFLEAADDYLKLVDKNKADQYVYKQLGDCYFNIYNTKEAEKWYQKVLEFPNPESELYFKYAQMLKANGNYTLADKQMEIFANLMPNDSRTILFLKNKAYLKNIDNIEKKYEIKEMEINSDKSDFGAFMSNDKKLYFASARNNNQKNYSWTTEPFLDIYMSECNKDGKFSTPKLVEELASEYNDGPMSVTADGKTIYFASESFRNKSYQKLKRIKLGKVNIFRARVEEGKILDIEPLSINSSEFTTANPCISADGKTLYFSSNRPGSIGATDIWKVNVNKDGSLGEPENLGKKVNTEGRESFPFVSDNKLYFASDGHPGLGGYDIFEYDLQKQSEPINMGKPINSEHDDFAFTFNKTHKLGFISSNRNGKENDNLFQFVKKCESKLKVVVLDEELKTPIAEADVVLYENKTAKDSISSDFSGTSYFKVDCDKIYTVKIKRDGFEEKLVDVPRGNDDNQEVVVHLPPTKTIITDKEIILSPIYFEFDKSNITAQGARELTKLVKIMNENPNLKIEIGSHTDSRGNDAYNQKLSERRAFTTRQFVISKGIAKERLTAFGFGESKPKVQCSKCTEAQHAQNRRSEFLIVK